jgi:hypothetical protein
MSLKAILVISVVGSAFTRTAFLLWHRSIRFGTSIPKLAYIAFPSRLALLLFAAYIGTNSVGCARNPEKNRPRVAWTKASGEVPDLVLPKGEIEKTSVVLAAPSSDNLKQLSAVVNEKQNLAVYNAIFSPLSALGNNVLVDGQPTRVDFYIGDPSKDNAIPTDNITINSQVLAKSQHLTVTLSCSFCDQPMIQKGVMDYPPAQNAKSQTTFNIVPRNSLAKTADNTLVFEVTGNGILYDNVVVPVAIAVGEKVSDTAKASAAPNAAIGNIGPPPGSRAVDLTITTKIKNNNVAINLTASNSDLAQAFGGKEKDQNGLPRDLDTGLAGATLSDTLREDYVALYAAISQDKNVAKSLHVDSRALALPQSTKLTSPQGQVLLGVMFKAGAILYRKLFVTSAEPDLVTLTGTLDKFVRKDGKPLLIRIETGGISIPWELLHPTGAMDQKKFWGFRYDMVIDPLGRPRPGFYPGILQYQTGPLIFGKYKAALGEDQEDQDVSNKADSEALYLSTTVGFTGLLKVDSADAFKKALADNENTIRMVVIYLHARNNIAVQALAGAAPAQPYVEGPELLFGASDTVTVGSLEELYLGLPQNQVQVFGVRPLVFLNACQTGTGNFLSTGDRNFPGTFLDMGARGVIATEAPVWITFADDFARALAKDLAGESPVSVSVLNERLSFLKSKNNPLGLMYEYYGGVDAAVALH